MKIASGRCRSNVARAGTVQRKRSYLWRIIFVVSGRPPTRPAGLLQVAAGRARSKCTCGTCPARAHGPAVREFGHSDVAPGPGNGSSPGTSCRKSLPGPADRGPAAGLMAVRQVPSESVAQGAATAPQVGGKWVPCVEPLRPVLAGLLCVQLVSPQVSFRSAGALWAAMSGVKLPGHRPGGRLPSGPASSVRPSPQQWRASGAGDAVGVRGAWVVQLPAAVARATR